MKKIIHCFFVLAAALLLVMTTAAQFKVETFGKFKKMGANPDVPTDFKTSFPVKSQVYLQFTFPAQPSDYRAECYWIDNGQEKMRGSAVFKCYDKTGKPVKYHQGFGMMYDAGEYRVIVKDSKDNLVAESRFTVSDVQAAATQLPKASIAFCEDTDDNLKPIKPILTNSIKKGDGINLLAKLDKGIGARFFIWSIYEVQENGDEKPWKDWQVDVSNEKWTLFATDQKIYFTNPGKYAIYMLPQNGTNTGTTIGNHTRYYGKAVLEVK